VSIDDEIEGRSERSSWIRIIDIKENKYGGYGIVGTLDILRNEDDQ